MSDNLENYEMLNNVVDTVIEKINQGGSTLTISGQIAELCDNGWVVHRKWSLVGENGLDLNFSYEDTYENIKFDISFKLENDLNLLKSIIIKNIEKSATVR